ncbi:methionyl-tRNA formyltransferase [Candidatus Omnitrophota bacterium]
MKIVFFGSSDFAVPSLERLIESQHKVVTVVTQPDREKGRNLKISATPVKEVATAKDTTVYQPEDVTSPESIKHLKSLKADLFIVVAFGRILPTEVLDIPKLYSMNLHASLLPKYRGAAPINYAVMKGEKKTGLTVIRMNEKMDAGDIMLQRSLEIERTDDAETMSRKLADLGSVLILDAMRFIELDKVKFKTQPQKTMSRASKLTKEDGLVDWKKPNDKIHNMVRGLVPWPCAYTYFGEKMIKIWKSETMPSYQKIYPGTVIEVRKDFIAVACGKNALIIKELQLEGGKRMSAADFLRGHKIEKSTFFGNLGETPPPPPPPEPEEPVEEKPAEEKPAESESPKPTEEKPAEQ